MLLNNSENPESNISELLNAAADNAKELILNKINAGMNLAGMHGYLMQLIRSNQYRSNYKILIYQVISH